MYPGHPAQPGGPGSPQGAAAAGPVPPAAAGGSPFLGGGAPDGGLSAAYAAWAAAAYGGGYGAGMPAGYAGGGAKGSASGAGEKGYGKGRGCGKGKGKGKSWKGGFGAGPLLSGGGGGPGFDAGLGASDPRRQIELAQRRAKQRDRSAISEAQRFAQQRFERDLLERIQGSWVDASDSSTSYVVDGGICAVSGGESSRTFRNRLGVYGGELCWDARRFWHRLDISALPPPGEAAERVEWSPGAGSPPTRPIVWIRAPAEAGGAEDAAADGKGEEAVPEDGPQFVEAGASLAPN
uniref:Uncharacterized protein n=1 Tax=Alexandrium monilatum TaxID=311494 RepID=A0A7S4RB25_9DINO